MASTTIPTSKATNAYDLLSDVRALILAEPKRLHMNYWKLVADSESVSAAQVPKGFPECGTVACIGRLGGNPRAYLAAGRAGDPRP
jgi:hypothetical protein